MTKLLGARRVYCVLAAGLAAVQLVYFNCIYLKAYFVVPLLEKTIAQKVATRSDWYRNSSANVCGDEGLSLLPEKDCSNVEWPRSNKRNHTICPWPDQFNKDNFVNFTVANARILLRGKTILINGDSTSRRLMWALCNFLAHNTTKVHASNGEGCCGARRIDIHCNIPEVLKHDILIEYNPALLYPHVAKWMSNGGLTKAYKLRNQTALNGELDNGIPQSHMPSSKVPRALHVFHPVAATWHVDAKCHGLLPEKLLKSNKTCELDNFVNVSSVMGVLRHGVANHTNSTACALVSSFCRRFMDTSAESFPHMPVHMHGITNVLAYPGVRGHNASNDWMLTVARATRDADMCTAFGHENDFRERKFDRSISCVYFEQTTWMQSDPWSSKRHDCMPSDGWSGIHVYNEYAMLMRVQMLLNAILQAEEESMHAS